MTVNCGIVRLWNVPSGVRRATLPIPRHETEPFGRHDVRDVRAVAFSPNGKRLAVGVQDEVNVWDLDAMTVAARLRWHPASVAALAFSPDGHTLATAGGEIRLWDLRPSVPDIAVTTSLQHTLRGHPHWVNAVTFSPDGRTLASGDSSRNLRLWAPATGKLISTHGDAASSDGGEIRSLAFLPRGHQLLLAGSARSEPGALQFFNVAAGRICARCGPTKTGWNAS